jgi:hypothetical protein
MAISHDTVIDMKEKTKRSIVSFSKIKRMLISISMIFFVDISHQLIVFDFERKHIFFVLFLQVNIFPREDHVNT